MLFCVVWCLSVVGVASIVGFTFVFVVFDLGLVLVTVFWVTMDNLFTALVWVVARAGCLC